MGYDVARCIQHFNILENRIYLQDYWMKSLETLHVHADHQPEEHRSSFNVTIVIV